MGFLLDPFEARCEPGELVYFKRVKCVDPGHPA